MEEIKSSNTSNQRRQKIVVGGVGGIAGVLVLAGAFAAASLIKNKTSKKKPDTKINLEGSGPPSPTQKINTAIKEKESQGLRSLLQISSLPVESHNSSSIEHDASKVSSTEIDCHLETTTVETTKMEEISTIEVDVEEQISTCESKMIESGNSNALDDIDMVKTSNHTGNYSCSEEVGSKVLCSVLQLSSPSVVESHQSSSIGHEGSEAISTQVDDHFKTETAGIMIMEETSTTTDNVEENMSICEDHKDESGNWKDENLWTDDINMIKDGIFPENSEEIPSLDIDKGLLIYSIEVEDRSDSRGAVSINKEGGLPEITHVSDVISKENLLVPLKVVEEYDGAEDKTESEIKGTEGTLNSCIGSNSEEVCLLKVTPIQIDNHSETETTEAPIEDEVSAMEDDVEKEIFTCEDQSLESENLKVESLWTSDIVDKTENGGILTCIGEISPLDTNEGVLVDDSIKKNLSDLTSTIAEGDQSEVTHVNDAILGDIISVPKEVGYSDEGDEMEGEREDSEGTHDSSIESNSEAVWPTESIEEELSLLKYSDRIQILRKKNDKETSKEAQFEGGFNNLSSLSMDKETGFKLICPPFLVSSRPEFWLWSLLAVALLCLLFGNHLPIMYHRSDSQL
ncbi:hypothetical protein AQUCO_01700124v1 [Aquilegia coerulea]|uniref:Uncharacterized protein n=1 Tax=Aquilegia coerulea TaxID=218851 RepID=A0A2G5DLB5_AQUCA|nr:hypothetical protein AQUCO_01700124v1 [Aquilegia coerulea]